MQQILIHISKFHAAFSVACWKVDGFRLHLLNANTLAFTHNESQITIHTSVLTLIRSILYANVNKVLWTFSSLLEN